MAFTAPGILFLEGWNKPQRVFVRDLLKALRASGYTSTHEPAAGAFAMSTFAASAGFAPEQMTASDVSMFSAVLGFYLTGRDLGPLGICVGELPYTAQGDTPAEQAADVLCQHLLLRHLAKERAHNDEYARDLIERREHHRSKIARKLEQMHERIGGLHYTPMGLWDHVDQVKDDPHAIVMAAPPSWTGGYEELFATGGRMTWAEPHYDIWKAGESHLELYLKAESWKALLLCVEPAIAGRCTHPQPLSAHDMAPGREMYVWSNRPDECQYALRGGPHASARNFTDPVRPSAPLLPYDWEPSDSSWFGLARLTPGEARYCRDLWAHRISPGGVSSQGVAVVVDGFIAGVFSYMTTAQYSSSVGNVDEPMIALLQGAFGAPHEWLRMGRLTTMIGCARTSLVWVLGTMNGHRVGTVQTTVMTKHPEAKVNRGILKLTKRVVDPIHGFRLTYQRAPYESDIEEVSAEWLKREQQRRLSKTAA